MYSHRPYPFHIIAHFFLISALAGTLRAQVKVEDPAAFAAIGDAGLKVEKLHGGMTFTEGPVWDDAAASLYFSDIPASRLMRWTPETGVTVMRVTKAANGNTLDREGRVISCQHAGRNVIRLEKDGSETVLASEFQGKPLSSPNDAVVKSDGSIWFTDPPYGLPKGAKKAQEKKPRLPAGPRRGNGDGGEHGLRDAERPGFSPDEKRLYIADSGQPQRVGAFDVKADGTLSPAVFWLEGGSDGMRVDAAGNLYTTSGAGVRVYSPEGKKIATIECPEGPANCAFGGPDHKTLFITAQTSLYSVRLKIPGATRPESANTGK